IRTPMNAILGFSDLIMETKLDFQQQDYLNKIRHSSKSLLQIINKILDFSSVDSGEMLLEKNEFSVEDILKELIHFFGDQALEKHIELVIHQDKDIPALLIGDALRLQQILANLLSNSIKFTDIGVITVKVKLISGTAEKVSLEFNVKDTGIGIASEDLSTLFAPFSQADGSTTRQYEGTGLGLAISKQLVELLGGELVVSSKEGIGTSFTFAAEFDTVGEWNQAESSQGFCSSDKSIMSNIRGAHLLLVEDDSINCQVAEAILAKANISVDIATNGKQALEKIFTAKMIYDAVLMDIRMPVMGGVECVQEMRQREADNELSPFSDRLPVIAMTANVLQGDRERFLQAGMDDYIAKPVNKTELFAILAKWMSKNNFFTTRIGNERRRSGERVAWSGKDRREREERRKLSADGSRQESDEYSLPEDLPGIDLKQGLARLEGNSGLYIRLLKEFAVDISSTTDNVLEALEAKDQECAIRLVHTVKGMAGSLGAVDLAAASLALEMPMRKGGDIKEEFSLFTKELQSTQESLSFFRNEQTASEAETENSQPVDEKKVVELMLELDTLLSEKNFEAGSKWDELKPLMTGTDKMVITQIENMIARFDFETSRGLLQKLQK
ncbi:MAG: response regulator, partial [Desulfocapsa sp.]|nr:response regulator [Desulfocapsa sp.]